MAPGIEFFTGNVRDNARSSKIHDLDPPPDKAVGIEVENQFIQPGDEETLERMTFDRNGYRSFLVDEVDVGDEGVHPQSRVDKHVSLILAESPYAGITGTVEKLEPFHRDRAPESAFGDEPLPALRGLFRLLLLSLRWHGRHFSLLILGRRELRDRLLVYFDGEFLLQIIDIGIEELLLPLR